MKRHGGGGGGGPLLWPSSKPSLCILSFASGACAALVLIATLPNHQSILPPSYSAASKINAANHDRELVKSLERADTLLARADPVINAHNQQMQQLDAGNGTDEICSKAIHHIDLPFPWLIFKPTWNCFAKERVGNQYDGGKWHCNINALRRFPKCIIYSLGSNADVGYETAVRERTDCEIHVFDPTVSKERVQPLLPTNAFFHEIGVAGHTGTIDIAGKPYKVSSIKDIMAELGHERVNVLKMDIEGNEYGAIAALAKSDTLATRIDELLIEFHWHSAHETVNAFEELLRAGFRIFSHEPNLFYRPMPAAGIEYSFIHTRVAETYNM